MSLPLHPSSPTPHHPQLPRVGGGGTGGSTFRPSEGGGSTTTATATSRTPSSHTFKFLPELNTYRHDASVCVVDLSPDVSSSSSSSPSSAPTEATSTLPTTTTPTTTTTTTTTIPSQPAIVVVGGFSSLPTLRQVELLEWNVLRRWWQMPSLHTARCGCALVVHNKRQLFCLGGLGVVGTTATTTTTGTTDSGSLTPLATMETWTIGGTDSTCGSGSSSWEILPTTMMTPRMYPAAVAFTMGSVQSILVVGGKDQSFQELETCELYSLETGQWEPFPSMTRRRFACGLVYLPSRHSVVAIGGFDAVEWTTSMELYDLQKDVWTELPPMIRPVQFVTATLLTGSQKPGEEYIVVRGQAVVAPNHHDDHVGMPASAILQCYNVLTMEWIILPPTSTMIGAAMTSVDHTRIVTVGGGTAEAASGTCRFWMPNLPKLFSDKNVIEGLPTVALEPSQSATFSICDESTVHPWLYHHTGSASVAASVARSIASPPPPLSPTGNNMRRKVDHMSLIDRLGVPVQYTGFLHADSGKPHGKGIMIWPRTGDKYEGRFEQGVRYGRGQMLYENGDCFIGFYQNDLKEGHGVYKYSDGRVYEGNYRRDEANDKAGRMTWPNGTIFVGDFIRGNRTGGGKIVYPSSRVTYEGEFVNGKYHGYGQCQYQDGSVYAGEWKSGAVCGRGTLTTEDGQILHDGTWLNDRPVINSKKTMD